MSRNLRSNGGNDETFTFDIRGTSLETFVEVLNVWNRANAEEFGGEIRGEVCNLAVVDAPDGAAAGIVRPLRSA